MPGILYGPKRTTTSITVAAEEFEQKIAHLEGAHLIRLLHAAAATRELHERMVLVREMQLHPVSGRALHADFYEVDLTERLDRLGDDSTSSARPVGVVNGGILQPILREIEVECLPTEIPDFIEVDVTALDIHDAVHVGRADAAGGRDARRGCDADHRHGSAAVDRSEADEAPAAEAAQRRAAPRVRGSRCRRRRQQPAPKKSEG